MVVTRIEGIPASHQVVNDVGRLGRGDVRAIEGALAALREDLLVRLASWPAGAGHRFHLVLTVEKGGAA